MSIQIGVQATPPSNEMQFSKENNKKFFCLDNTKLSLGSDYSGRIGAYDVFDTRRSGAIYQWTHFGCLGGLLGAGPYNLGLGKGVRYLFPRDNDYQSVFVGGHGYVFLRGRNKVVQTVQIQSENSAHIQEHETEGSVEHKQQEIRNLWDSELQLSGGAEIAYARLGQVTFNYYHHFLLPWLKLSDPDFIQETQGWTVQFTSHYMQKPWRYIGKVNPLVVYGQSKKTRYKEGKAGLTEDVQRWGVGLCWSIAPKWFDLELKFVNASHKKPYFLWFTDIGIGIQLHLSGVDPATAYFKNLLWLPPKAYRPYDVSKKSFVCAYKPDDVQEVEGITTCNQQSKESSSRRYLSILGSNDKSAKRRPTLDEMSTCGQQSSSPLNALLPRDAVQQGLHSGRDAHKIPVTPGSNAFNEEYARLIQKQSLPIQRSSGFNLSGAIADTLDKKK
jgi:hypothetical protein